MAAIEGKNDLFIHEIDRLEKGIMSYMPDPVGDALRDKQFEKDQALNQKIVANFKASDVDAIYKKLGRLEPIHFYLHEIQTYLKDASIPKTVSNSDGKFNMHLKGDDWVLVAFVKGKDGNPMYFWLVKLPAEDKRVSLSDANSFEKGCPTCLLSGTDKSLDSAQELSMAAYAIQAFPKKHWVEQTDERRWLFDYVKKAGLI